MSLRNCIAFRCLTIALFILPSFGATISSAQSLKYSTSLFQNKDWSFVENKGQLADTTPNPRQRGTAINNDIRYYGHQGGVYLYCKPGMISFVFTKVENDERISEATGRKVYDVGVQNSASLFGESLLMRQQRSLLSAPRTSVTISRTDLVLINSNPNAQILASDQQEYYENYYTTGNANSGITNVHTFKTITYKEIYPHIDMVLSCREKGLEYSFVVYPGGKVSDIQMQWVGIEGIKKLKNLKIEYSCTLGKIEEGKPVSFQGKNHVESDFLRNDNKVGFKVDKYDKEKALVIDPTLIWGTYFGGKSPVGNGGSAGMGVSCDRKGNVYIVGTANSSSSIATTGAYQTSYSGGGDMAFLAKFDSSGALKWATYFGGPYYANGNAIATDSSGNVYITGDTQSDSGVATSGAYQTFNGGAVNSSGAGDAFLAKFNGKGQILWATYYGGSKYDYGTGVATDGTGNVYLTGATLSTSGIATVGAYKVSYTGINLEEAFLVKFDSSGSRQWGTYFGGALTYSNSVACDASGNVYITGQTSNDSEITTNRAYQVKAAGFRDAFLAKFNGNGKIQWATYYGGSNEDGSNSVAIDRYGNVYITGSTSSSSGIATSGVYQASFIGTSYSNYVSDPDYDGFLAKFNSAGAIQWATYYDKNKTGYSVATDRLGNVYITGLFNINGDAFTAFVAGFSSAGKLEWETTCGEATGINFTEGNGIATDGTGNIYVTGETSSNSGIVTSGAYQTYNVGDNAFLIKFGQVDAGISSVINPKGNVCPDSQTIQVRLHNFGVNPFDSVIIKWSVNGKLEPDYHWKGNLAPDSSATITIGIFLAFAAKDTVKSWTSLPDASIDANPYNDTSTIIINVILPPVVNTGPDKSICENGSTSIGGPGISGNTYSWTSNPAGFSSTVPNVVVSPKQTTVYYLKETANATGCHNVDSVILTISPPPFVNTGLHQFVCKGDSAIIGGPAITGYLYNWTSSPSGFSSSSSNPVVAPGNSTQFTLTVTDSATGCTNSASVLITVKPLPVANVGQSVFQICNGARVKLGGNAMPDMVYSWTSNPAGFTSTMSDPFVMPATSSWYYLIVRDTTTNCSNRDSTSVILSASQVPVADAGVNQTICAGDSVPIGSHAVAGNIYIWSSNPSGFKSAFPVTIAQPAYTTTYFLNVTNTAGCINFDSITITVNPLPNPKIKGPIEICAVATISYATGFDSASKYTWSVSKDSIISGQGTDSITLKPGAGYYHLKVTETDHNNCHNTDSITVFASPVPDAHWSVISDSPAYIFKALDSTEQYYQWLFGDGGTGSNYQVSHKYLFNRDSGIEVSLTVGSAFGCSATFDSTIKIHYIPPPNFYIEVFPTPFGQSTNIKISLGQASHIQISAYDAIGRLVGKLIDLDQPTGVTDYAFNAAKYNLAYGVYYLKILVDGKVYIRPIVKVE